MFRATTSGLGEIRGLLARLPEAVSMEKAQVAIHLAATPTAEMASTLCPRGPGRSTFQRRKHGLGHLADAIKVFDLPPEGRTSRVAVSYPRSYFWGHFLEWGTSSSGPRGEAVRESYVRRSRKTGELKVGYTRKHKALKGRPGMRARPFLRPAWDAEKAEYLPRFGEYLWQALRAALPYGGA